MESIVILFGMKDNAQSALDEIHSSISADDVDVRVVEFDENQRQDTEFTAIGLPVPATGGAVPVWMGSADLDLDDEEREFIMSRATSNGTIVQVKTKAEHLDHVKQIARHHNGQFYEMED